MKDSSRWLLIIALVALISVLSGNGFGWFSFGFHLGFLGKVALIALVIWIICDKGCSSGVRFCASDDDSGVAEASKHDQNSGDSNDSGVPNTSASESDKNSSEDVEKEA